jgi:hypothetical protein
MTVQVDPADVAVGLLIAKHGMDLEEAEETVKTFNLSDMEFDEVSFVERGANQRAHVVLWKSDEPVSKQQNTAAPGPEVARQLAQHVKTNESVEGAYRTASSRVLAEELADEMRSYNPSLTSAQCLARVYELHPELYAAELSASDLMSHRQTRTNDEARRFA